MALRLGGLASAVGIVAALLLSACTAGQTSSIGCLTEKRSAPSFSPDDAHFIRNGSGCVGGEAYLHVVRLSIVSPSLNGLLCSGTLIAPDIVLTAAHCMETLPVLQVVTAEQPARGVAADTAAYRTHPGFDPTSSDLYAMPDLAVLFLKTPIVGIPVAHLATDLELVGAEVAALGYGYDGHGDDGDGNLGTLLFGALKIEIPGSDGHNTVASAKYKPFNSPESQETCAGDSGGPLFPLEEPRSVVGVLTGGEYYGEENCKNSKNSVYTPVPLQRAWIEQVIADGPTDPANIVLP